ncbi:heat shock protein 9/12 [Suhomyces tanzawaensis NRRL Y-17324]|uniref:Heat shock protein 9/12 n=1 Tax=Suhomyces tanzawaensis NRRL Y-17324 TaxID=984487 RepID=A0A1E4SEW8_9ASCO|nr:heat shock protein 9/12 [Suhomyces tanzawaensis NRRL Y-17324]ODV78057.1 heat shock protein 9/12 [Suhomyces tanzawaensis NRRL Y-17324]
MSDLGRKDISDKVQSAVTPDSQKSTLGSAKDKVTDSVDNAIGDNTSSKDKSFVQQASDAIFGEKK